MEMLHLGSKWDIVEQSIAFLMLYPLCVSKLILAENYHFLGVLCGH